MVGSGSFMCGFVCVKEARLPESMQQVYENSLFMSRYIRLSVGVCIRVRVYVHAG